MHCLWERQVVFVKRWKGPSRDGLAVPFAAVLDKPSGQRWRFIAWPKARNAREDAEVTFALPFHISQYLSAKWDEAAALLDLVASFYRRLFWRICTGEFPLSSGIRGSRGIDSPHTGHESCPEVPRTAARVLAEDPEMVRPQSVAPRVVRTPAWLCIIRTSGLRRSVVQRGHGAAKKWHQRENRRLSPRGVKPSVHP
ncbi:hypothetical protein TcYC6_0017010 [Trypanosoma cruzi]|nr:hypothetical protein TcYC6_0017010 [Trypanosoma cruzi]